MSGTVKLSRNPNALATIVLLAVTMPCTASAQSSEELHPFLQRGFWVDVGMFFPDRELNLRVNGSLVGINDPIEFDERFGLENADETFAGELAWRYTQKWIFLAQYFKSSGSSQVVLDEDIAWEDVVFQAGTNATGGTDFSLTRFYFGYTLTSNPRIDAGVGLGFHWLHIAAFIEGTALVNGQLASTRESVSVDGPLPNLGFWYAYSLTPNLAFRTRFDWLSANIDDYSGQMLNLSAGFNLQVLENVGIGLNYNYFELDGRVKESDWRGQIETIYDGVFVYASIFF